MTDDSTRPKVARNNLLFWCGAPLAIALVLGGIAGGWAYFTDTSEEDARAACEQTALLRGEGSELTEVDVEHVRADEYRVSGVVETPGLPDEEFVGYASKGSGGDYSCNMSG